MLVKCVDDLCSNNKLIAGKVYKVVETITNTQHEDDNYYVLEGVSDRWWTNRFIPAAPGELYHGIKSVVELEAEINKLEDDRLGLALQVEDLKKEIWRLEGLVDRLHERLNDYQEP